jgi:hypothetical protein
MRWPFPSRIYQLRDDSSRQIRAPHSPKDVAEFQPCAKLRAARAYSVAGLIPSGPDVDFQPRWGQIKGDYHGFGQIPCHGGGSFFGDRADGCDTDLRGFGGRQEREKTG